MYAEYILLRTFLSTCSRAICENLARLTFPTPRSRRTAPSSCYCRFPSLPLSCYATDGRRRRDRPRGFQAQKVLQKSQQMARNEHTLNYDERNPFEVDCLALTPIYRGSPMCKCPYCASAYQPAAKGSVCVTCGLSQVGVETLGLVTTSSASGGGKR